MLKQSCLETALEAINVALVRHKKPFLDAIPIVEAESKVIEERGIRAVGEIKAELEKVRKQIFEIAMGSR